MRFVIIDRRKMTFWTVCVFSPYVYTILPIILLYNIIIAIRLIYEIKYDLY